jgi:diguanylate cyclase (GGDEF)-like protein/PAS domain S-box-containing protein
VKKEEHIDHLASESVHDRQRLVLIVDDSGTMRMLMRASLEDSGFAVLEAHEGPEAIEIFSRQSPDTILMDVEMPKMSGFETCQEIRKLPEGEHVPIIMVTGRDDLESVTRAYHAGATDFISKPINWTVLGHRVRYMLRASNAFHELRESEARLANAQRLVHLGNWEWDVEKSQLFCSGEVYRIFGLAPREGKADHAEFLSRVHPEDKALVEQALVAASKGDEKLNIELRIHHQDAIERFVHLQAEPILTPKGEPAKLEGTVQDITARKEAEAKIRYLAYYDGLTKLGNRQLFMERLDKVILYAKRYSKRLAVLYIDLDRFKQINDTLGHSAGDTLLKATADRLESCIRSSDTIRHLCAEDSRCDLSRLGGDEFAVLLSEINNIRDAAEVANRILEEFRRPFQLGNLEFVITPSLGIAAYPRDGMDVDTLLKHADVAMYHAKREGRNNFQFYTKAIDERSLEKLRLENQLRKALEREELLLHYQPKVDIQSGRIAGVEALLRWQGEDGKLLSPAEFIPLAEETGLIVPIGEWVLQTACRQAAAWHAAGLGSISVAVNVSSLQFRQGNLTQTVSRALKHGALDARYLELEVTESTIMENAIAAIETLHELKDMGAKLSIDDFGTGYSSLSYLKRFPLDVLKIDRSFIKEIHDKPEDAAITAAIIAMAQKLNLLVIAEGVETETQLSLLRKWGCDQMQGFLFSRPLPVADLEQLIIEWGNNLARIVR